MAFLWHLELGACKPGINHINIDHANTGKQLKRKCTMIFDKAKTQQILNEAKAKAVKATQDYLTEWKTKTGGNQYGEPMYCGFAWIVVKARSNSKLGKLLQENGFEKSYNRSGALDLWNPSGYYGQSMDVKERGAWAYAEHLNANGIPCGWQSRAD